MKRFYKDATVVPVDDGHGIYLDGKPVHTPARVPLVVPTAALAEAVADEWRAQGEVIDPRAMTMTGLANATIDQVIPTLDQFSAGVARYAESDLLCYRAHGPDTLVARQAEAWDPLLEWAQVRFGINCVVTQGIIPVPQEDKTMTRLAEAVAEFTPFRLTPLSTLVTLTGSLICGLAVAEGAFDAEIVWDASEIDERWQAEQWGEDAEVIDRATRRRTEFLKATAFAALAHQG